MKKTDRVARKLNLARESLKQLSEPLLAGAAGGALPYTARLQSCGGGCNTHVLASCVNHCTAI